MIYLASPYTHDERAVRQARARLAARAAAWVMYRCGDHVYSPIAHGSALEPHLPTKLAVDHDFWMRHCLNMLKRCDSLLVYCIEGWKESKGVQMEIEYAKTATIPIQYMWPADDFVPPDIRDVAP
jgi:Domain of unknown function (DUF1937)